MNRILLVLTTANQFTYTAAAVRSIVACAVPGVDLLVVDDCSDDGTVEILRADGVNVLTKAAPKGLTNSWNLAYREWIGSEYDLLILANNDILVPRGAIEQLRVVLEERMIAGVMSTCRGVGHQPAQDVRVIHPCLPVDESEPTNAQLVQDYVCSVPMSVTARAVPYINGFFFGITREVRRYERSDGNLFDPSRTNTGNEDDLCRRVGLGSHWVCGRSFVFHYKGGTLDLARRDTLKSWGGRNMLWTTARRLFG